MVGRHDDDDAVDEPRLTKAAGEGEGEGGLAGPRGCGDEVILGFAGLVLLEGLPLPEAQFPGSNAHLARV